MVQMDAQTRAEAANAIGAFASGGGTAIGAWLDLAGRAVRLGARR